MRKKINVALVSLVLLLSVLGCKNLTGSKTDAPPSSNAPANSNKTSGADKIKELKAKADELGDLEAPSKLDPNAKIKGKVAFVIVSADGSAELEGFDGDALYDNGIVDYRFTKSDVAASLDEIEYLIRIKCSKGKQIGTYDTTDKREFPAYELKCDVNVIDYKAKTTVAQKSFTSKRLDDDIKVDKSTAEKTAYVPRRDIADFLDTVR